MKYILMMHHSGEGASILTWPPEAVRAHIDFMKALNKELEASGELVAAEGLAWPNEAKIVHRGKDGRTVVNDGPFPETKEFLAGYWMVRTATEARAIEIAARASAAPDEHGRPLGIRIEVRQVMSAPDLPA